MDSDLLPSPQVLCFRMQSQPFPIKIGPERPITWLGHCFYHHTLMIPFGFDPSNNPPVLANLYARKSRSSSVPDDQDPEVSRPHFLSSDRLSVTVLSHCLLPKSFLQRGRGYAQSFAELMGMRYRAWTQNFQCIIRTRLSRQQVSPSKTLSNQIPSIKP